jgi:nicotinamidase-related amidase
MQPVRVDIVVFVAVVTLLQILCVSTFGFTPSTVVVHSQSFRRLKMSATSDPVLPSLRPEETAFVFIEYQNEFCSPGGKLYDAVKECLEETNMLATSIRTLQRARAMGSTIIHCPISFEEGHAEISKTPYGILSGVKEGAAFTAGTWGAAIVEGMQPIPGDLVVKGKSGLCGFASTNLDFLLRQHSIKNVVLAGFLTNCCVESTMRTAYELGYQVYTLKDCVAATSMAAQTATLQYNFGMFSVPTTSDAVLNAIVALTVTA